MAAALRTPSLKYRSFGNEPVRCAAPVPALGEEQALGILDDVLAGLNDLSAEAVLGDAQFDAGGLLPQNSDPVPFEPSRYAASGAEAFRLHASRAETSQAEFSSPALHRREVAHAEPAAGRGDAGARRGAPAIRRELALAEAVAGHRPPVFVPERSTGAGAVPPPWPAADVDAAPRPVFAPVMQAPPSASRRDAPRGDGHGSTLLQELLGMGRLPIAPRVAPPASPPPGLAANTSATPATGTPRAATPVSLLPLPPAPFRPGLSTGSSLLDTLVGAGAGRGAPAPSGGVHYPLLDALGAAMLGTSADPSPRHWPAARVDIALPELLRRVAAGLRTARSAA